MKIVKLLLVGMCIGLTIGCASNNVRSYRPDPLHTQTIQKQLTRKVYVKRINMPEGNTNSILCRLAGNIYLPNKSTYSEYIEEAFKRNLLMAGLLTDSSANVPGLSVELVKVDFSSTQGKWYIDANVAVNNNKSVVVQSETKFGTSFDASSACANVANAFEDAVSHFVTIVLTKKEIVDQLHHAT